ncbi:hypothetical protein HGRIS_008224 [Hohenbuehelia grisea]|uniref:Pentatricopeptide repeat-containing protein n=1 Tax=Hohenbuehelia grisea TaxID=104357 RepID=A0ABR3J7S1_9AGAR
MRRFARSQGTDALVLSPEKTEALVHSPAAPSPSIRELHNTYRAIVAEQRNKSATQRTLASTILTQEQLITVINGLGTSEKPADLNLITDVAAHLPKMFGMNLTTEIHDAVLRALIRNGHTMAARNWLQSMAQKSGQINPSHAQWHLFLKSIESGALNESFKFLHNCVRQMTASGCKPNNTTFKVLIGAKWAMTKNSYPHVIAFQSLVDEMKELGIGYSASVEALLYQNYVDRGLVPAAIEISQYYRSKFPNVRAVTEDQERQWEGWLADAARRDGVRGAATLLKKFQEEGCSPSPEIFQTILRFSSSVGDIRFLENTFSMVAHAQHWGIIINNLARTGQIPQALSAYKECKDSGIKPHAALVGPIIGALCRTSLRPPSSVEIDQAMRLYHELAEAVPVSEHVSGETVPFSDHPVGPNTDIYRTLLRAMSMSPDTAMYSSVVKTLVDDMLERKEYISDSVITSSVIIMRMRASADVDEAFGAYKALREDLDATGYTVVLNAFSKLPLDPDGHLPALRQYFDIVRDMREEGHTMTPVVYTILLRELAKIGTRMKQPDSTLPWELSSSLVNAVRRAHDMLTLDASLSPDIRVLNQLMDTYQRLGCFAEAYRVWNMMYLSRQFDHVSVSIILDACGWAKDWGIAREVCVRLSGDNFLFDQHNWNTWIECLCRLGKLGDAVKTVCIEMGRGQTDVAPDENSVRILVKFARKINEQELVLARVKRYLPELWEKLPGDIKTG